MRVICMCIWCCVYTCYMYVCIHAIRLGVVCVFLSSKHECRPGCVYAEVFILLRISKFTGKSLLALVRILLYTHV